MRVTTKALIRNYQSSLNQSAVNTESARSQVLTNGRRYSSVAQDPDSASRASQLYRKYLKNSDYISMVKDVQSRQDSQESAIMQISSMAATVSKEYSLEALNGTNGAAERSTYATSLREYQQSMVLSLNATYEDEFIFAGADGANVPFTLSDDGMTLFYRGIDVNDEASLKEAGYDSEKIYVDMGFGLAINSDNSVVASSAFNASMPGINVTGFGVNEDGVSKNLVVLAGQMAQKLEADSFDSGAFKTLIKQFDKGLDDLVNREAQLGTRTNFLESTLTRLEDNEVQLVEQIDKVENVDLTEAITNYSWAQYAYDAALRVGNSILSLSFIDFMK
ncbi:flagellin N-terminal helical domain-containing protein [Parasporobacterium paucivorans]|uniref:Flagellar hook-associated protein 3 FlgL n=1 Tax=Parasporobacterium paucivorans DSM 15970 TaxID=1122934 RepID=A0A1M6I6D2_9FIRM|nr:flagellin [Parasporobacterium paucivorans]SHJ29982.1 flagellar hook-associated protein 3 FlgL [Parasporobacterium paucivorans DSM 15970]